MDYMDDSLQFTVQRLRPCNPGLSVCLIEDYTHSHDICMCVDSVYATKMMMSLMLMEKSRHICIYIIDLIHV